MNRCAHRFAWDAMNVDCAKPAHEGDPEHEGLYLRTRIVWLDGDRRDYTGEFVPCAWLHGCILPGGHAGNHAR